VQKFIELIFDKKSRWKIQRKFISAKIAQFLRTVAFVFGAIFQHSSN